MAANQIVTDLAREALKTFPDQPSKTIARYLRERYPEVFHSVEQARDAVRSHRGARGGNGSARPIAARTKRQSEDAKKWAALLPEPEDAGWKWHELPEEVSKWLVLADLHLPYHDADFLRAALRHADGHCDGVLLLGDAMDCYQLSHFCRDPRKRPMGGEIDNMKRLLDALAALDGIRRIVWKGGNHELRVERYIWQHAAQLADVPGLSLQSWCELDKRGVVWIPCQEPIRHHQLAILHGHEWGNRFSSPVNPARGAFLKAGECVLQAHEHRTSDHAESLIFGVTVSCWSVGCGCNLHPEYRPIGHKWNLGHAYLNTGSSWSVENRRFINGEVL